MALDVSATSLQLAVPSVYALHLEKLPVRVNADAVSAKFKKKLHVLILKLPLLT
jgi:hypothetical protein